MPTPDQAFKAYAESLGPDALQDNLHRSYFVAGWNARDALLKATSERHIVDVSATAWTMQHPIRERENDSLFDCTYNELVRVACEDGHLSEGRFEVWVEEGTHVLRWEEVS